MIIMKDKERIKKLYINGVSIKEITNRFNGKYKYDSLKKHIERNLKEHKEKHLFNKKFNKEINRITIKECKSYMTELNFIKNNLSIYKQKSNGEYVINKKVAPIVTFDTPKSNINFKD